MRVYFNEKGKAKVEIALARGKHLYDKREDMVKREIDMNLRKKNKIRVRREKWDIQDLYQIKRP